MASSRTSCSAAASSWRSVTLICQGLPPAVSAASMAAPMSSVCTWQFQSPSPPTTTIESPMRPQASLNREISASPRSRKYITS